MAAAQSHPAAIRLSAAAAPDPRGLHRTERRLSRQVARALADGGSPRTRLFAALETAPLSPVSVANADVLVRREQNPVSLFVELREHDLPDDQIVMFAELLDAVGANGIGKRLPLPNDHLVPRLCEGRISRGRGHFQSGHAFLEAHRAASSSAAILCSRSPAATMLL